MCDGCLYWSDANLIGSHSTNEQCHILRSPWPFTSSCKSIEGDVGEVSVHLLTSHFTPLHIPPLCVAPPGHAEWRPLVKRYSYRERDYAFGQMMLTLRTTIGLTQAGLADRLGVSRRAVAEWEAGSSYPK